MTTTQLAQPTATAAAPVNPKRIALAALAALMLNLVAFAVASAADATWFANNMTIGWYMVVFATLIPMAIGAGITVLLTRKTAAAPRVMAWVGLIFALVSVPMPFLMSSDAPTSLALAAMHVITGVAWFVGVLPRRAVAKG